MPTKKKKDNAPEASAPEATPESYSLRASVGIAKGTGASADVAGWSGSPVASGGTLTTTDRALFERLQFLGFGRAL